MESAIQTYEDMVKEVRDQLLSQKASLALVELESSNTSFFFISRLRNLSAS